MEKKLYIQPAVTVTELAVQNIIAASDLKVFVGENFDEDAAMEVRSDRLSGKAGTVEWDSWE